MDDVGAPPFTETLIWLTFLLQVTRIRFKVGHDGRDQGSHTIRIYTIFLIIDSLKSKLSKGVELSIEHQDMLSLTNLVLLTF